MSLAPEQIDEIEKRAEAATPGPWVLDPRGGGLIRGGALVHKARGSGQPQLFLAMAHEDEAAEGQQKNAAFVAAARTDIPALIADLRAARELLAEAMWRHEHMNTCNADNVCLNCRRIQAFLRGADET